MAKIRITQVKSRIHCTKRQKLNLDALGLRKLNATVEHEATPQIMGMINKTRHLLKITEI
jgi:large subunit ribosomal protein L30